ncbi:porin [Rhodocyclaceae bacterium]
MQKKIIALAVAGLVSGAAFAQSNVTIYGVADLGYGRLSGSEATPTFAKQKNYNGIDAGNQTTSRIGFRGTEDLGNGLSAGFTYEFGLTPDNGATSLTDRVQILTLSSKSAGTLVMGRLVNPARALVNAQDPFGGGTGVGHSQNIQFQTTWADNVIAYASPNFSGFDVTVGYSTQLANAEAAIAKGAVDTNIKGWVLVPKYANGPITAGLSYESFDRDGTAPGNQDLNLRRWNFAGSYDFGVAKLGGTYGTAKFDNLAAVAGDTDIKQWMLSVSAPITANGTLMGSYNRITIDNGPGNDAKASQWAVGYSHAMSKRTNAYVTYASLSTNNTAEGQFSVGNQFNALAAPTTSGYTNGLNVGLRHTF